MSDIAWGSAHMHSRYSAADALNTVPTMVEAARRAGWGSIGLSDHGNVAGIFELYKHANQAGLLPMPGVELYTTMDLPTARAEQKRNWMHMGLVATTSEGWDNLIGLVNYTHRNFWFRPAIDMTDLMMFGQKGLLDGIYALTGCFFGVIQKTLRAAHPDAVSGYTAAMNMLTWLTDAFGGRVMVELHHHNIRDHDHDDDIQIAVLRSMAKEAGLPTLITTDSHYSEPNEQPVHNLMKRLFSYKAENQDDAVFPGDGYWVVSGGEMRKRVGKEVWDEAYQGYLHMLDGYSLKVPELDTFQARLPRLASLGGKQTPEERLTELANEYMPPGPSAHQVARIHEELDVINNTGFAPYILLTLEVVDYCREKGIRFITRGSASGSYVCYLLGITQVDPLKWGLRFDRFLSRDRSKPPDIDLDIQDDRRHEVLDHLDSHYAITHVGNWTQMKRNPDDDEKGSLGQLVGRYKRNSPKGAFTEADEAALRTLDVLQPYSGMSKHAAGVVVLDDASRMERIPQMWIASSKTMVTALDKRILEDLGYVKLDVLGSATMSQVELMVRWTGIELDEIPLDDEETFKMIRRGDVAGVFQLDGWTLRRNITRLKPTKIADIVLAMALFRTSTLKSGAADGYIATKHRDRPKRHRIIEAHTKETKGHFIYQEQIIGVLRDLGMTPEELMGVLKAVKASNAAIGDAEVAMFNVRKQVAPLAEKHGMSPQDFAYLENAMKGYAEYSFNKSHAVSYGMISYYTAWFKANRPVDYWASVLAVSNPDKEKERLYSMLRESPEVPVLPPHVNKSSVSWSPDHNLRAIRTGLMAVDGIGKKTAERIVAGAPYSSIQDFGKRLSVSGAAALRKGHTPDACGGAVAALHSRRAFNGLI